MPQRDSPRLIVLFDRPSTTWLLLVGTLFSVVVLSLLGAAPVTWLYGEWAPARDFRGATLEDVVADFETTGIFPKGSTWASPELKGRRVTVRYSFYHQPSAVIEIVASKASIVVAGPADVGCSLCGVHMLGPVHIRAAAAGEPNVQWVRASREGAVK
jgi:hypothetical protein